MIMTLSRWSTARWELMNATCVHSFGSRAWSQLARWLQEDECQNKTICEYVTAYIFPLAYFEYFTIFKFSMHIKWLWIRVLISRQQWDSKKTQTKPTNETSPPKNQKETHQKIHGGSPCAHSRNKDAQAFLSTITNNRVYVSSPELAVYVISIVSSFSSSSWQGGIKFCSY